MDVSDGLDDDLQNENRRAKARRLKQHSRKLLCNFVSGEIDEIAEAVVFGFGASR